MPPNNSNSATHFSGVGLACSQRDQSLVPGVGDSDNSLNMRWVKSGAYDCMIQDDGYGEKSPVHESKLLPLTFYNFVSADAGIARNPSVI